MADTINTTENNITQEDKTAEEPNKEGLEKKVIPQVYSHRLVIVTGDKGAG